ncbi:MAG: precorrin-6Y C5,15-methyltransferase (decarboxylating) subunit CbiT, partial [Okeania sp. SIO2D1]|nr:precorrin-6Y C5,15-methyltransferase (decarboxylating) subunit CbiT [Okeania sp. SIO2D1]
LALETLPVFGLPDHSFASFGDRPGLMTKREIRLVILGELALQTGQVVWDIGAGTGSVAIEIARLCPTSQIYALEKTALGIQLIKRNCQRFQTSNVIPLHNCAPENLAQLPTPQRIFIGGSGGNLGAILPICDSRLSVGGVVVLALATLEHLQTSLEWFSRSNWEYHLLQVQISRSVPIAKLTRFAPLNPITIVRAIKKR